MIKGYKGKILKMYEELQREEEVSYIYKKEMISKKIPEITNIEIKIANFSVELSLIFVRNPEMFNDKISTETAIKKLKNDILDLRMRKSELLVKHGFPIDYLEHKYQCSKCNDTGYINSTQCSCFKQKLIQLYYKSSDLSDLIKTNNFENFNYNYFSTSKGPDDQESPRKKIERLVTKSKEYIDRFGKSDENFLFFGDSGTGKTYLSHCIAKEILDKGYLVIYRTSEQLMEDLRSIRFENQTQIEDVLVDCDLLIIDDLGTEYKSELSRTELYNLINKKLLKNKRMIISTNYFPEDLKNIYSDRITSRLFGNFTVFKFIGEDIRLKKNLSKSK